MSQTSRSRPAAQLGLLAEPGCCLVLSAVGLRTKPAYESSYLGRVLSGHLFYKFGITESDWYRIKQSIDSKCRTAWRRKQRGQSLAVKSFSRRTPSSSSYSASGRLRTVLSVPKLPSSVLVLSVRLALWELPRTWQEHRACLFYTVGSAGKFAVGPFLCCLVTYLLSILLP